VLALEKQYLIAIDGPVGAGKSTVAKITAKKLNIIYVDTGAMYRAVGLYVTRKGLDTKKSEDVNSVLNEINLDVKLSNEGQMIFLNGEDVTKLIRTPEISMAASNVSAIPEVRVKLVDMQRKLAETKSVIMDGRDIGTVVLPNATTKIYLNAELDERADRRYKELIKKGQDVTFEDVKADIVKRDTNDMSRAVSPLKKADDAIELDTTGLTLEEVVDKVIDIINGR
jgi:cytidylate kinase